MIWLTYIFAACGGALVGSLLNAYIHRECHNELTGAKESLLWPRRSYCPHCRQTIAWYDNIPLLSYLLLRGRCRSCHEAISLRYVCVEVLSSVLTVFVLDLFVTQRQDWAGFVIGLVLTYILIAIVFIDLKVMIIPDALSLGGLLIALGLGFLFPRWHGIVGSSSFWLEHLNGLKMAFYGMIVGGGLIYGIGLLGTWVFKKDAMGGGDVKMMAMVGAFLGWSSTWLILFLASLVGTLASMVLLARRSKTMSDEVPFGPYLAIGSWIALCWQHDIYHWLFYR